MSKIARYVGNLLAFGSSATGLNRTIFGDAPNQSDVLSANIVADFLAGWENGLDPVNGFPPQEYFNAVGFVATQLSAYLHQSGIAEWDNAQEFYVGNLTNVSGVVYRSLTDNNIGNDPTSDVINWADIVEGVLPIGFMGDWPTETPPTGWFFRDGSAISRATYAPLFGIIGTDYGIGDGATTFNLPDDRGLFGIGFDDGAGVDPDAGSVAALGGDTTIGTNTILNAPDVSVYINKRFLGAILTGTGIPADSRIVNWVGTTITIDKDATATATIADIGINFDVVGSRQTNASQGHIHYDGSAHNANTSFVYGSTTTDVPGLAASFVTSSGGVGTFQGLTSGQITDGVNGTPRISSVTRPNNSSRLPIIRAF